MSTSVIGGELAVQERWTLRSSNELCRLLSARYEGIHFVSLHISLSSDDYLEDYSDAEMVSVSFNLRGAAEELVRHRFAHPSWVGLAPSLGKGRRRAGSDLGNAQSIEKVRGGYRLTMASYLDGLDRIAAVIVPRLIQTSRERQP
jgi:hypothetical protein